MNAIKLPARSKIIVPSPLLTHPFEPHLASPPAPARLAPPTRILVACPMKCGSTYVAQWLALYFGLDRCQPLHYWGRTEQNLDVATMDSLKTASFVIQLHSKPYVPLMRWLTEAQVKLVFLWRNIADALVSLDEHIRTEDHRVPACYIHDPANYASLPAEERYAFLIQQAGPWYIQLYLMWKRADATLPIVKGHYEELLSSPTHFFERLISGLAGSVDHHHLTALMDQSLENTRFNQGLSGRSISLFSELNKWQLERLLGEYPEDLSDLLDELPWKRRHWRSGVFHNSGFGASTDLLVSNDFAHAPLGFISETASVKQTFSCRLPGLNTIELLCATYGRQIPAGVMKVRLEQSEYALRESEIPLTSVKDNSWVQFRFPPIPDSEGCEFDLIVSTEGVPEGYGFTIWASDINLHQRGKLRFDGEPHSGTLCMRTGCIAGQQNEQRLQTQLDGARQEVQQLNNELASLRAKGARQEIQRLGDKLANLEAKWEQRTERLQGQLDGACTEIENLTELQHAVNAISRQIETAKARSQRQTVRLRAIQTKVDDVSQQTQEILHSRIWRTLCAAGAVLLSSATLFGRRSSKNQVARRDSDFIRAFDRSRRNPASVEELHLAHCDEPSADAKPSSGKVPVRGWAAAQSGIAHVEVQLQGRSSVPAEIGLSRPDIGQHLPNVPESSQAGFFLEIDTSSLPTGDYPLYIRTTSRAGTVREIQTVLLVDHDSPYVSDYDRWIAEFEERDEKLIGFAERSFHVRPIVSILLPVYRTAPAILQRAIDSVIAQSYSAWELCIADDHSQSPEIEHILRSYAQRDPRIKLTFRPTNGGIAASSNAALNLASGEFVALLDHDDELAPDALHWVVDAINREPQAGVLYSDEDKIDEAGRRFDPFFKPDWSPDLLLSLNYVAHFLVCRRELAIQVGGFCSKYDGSQDYDLILRLAEKTDNIVHIPKILYHWRALPSSTASGTENKSYASEAAQRALQDHIERRGIEARVVPGRINGRWRVRYGIPAEPAVSIVIASGGKREVLRTNLKSVLQNTEYQNYEIVVIDNSKRGEIERLVSDFSAKSIKRIRYIDWRHQPFNYSAINNEAARHCSSPVLLFLNDDTEVISGDWLTAMVELAWRSEVGCVGAKLLYPDGKIQHAGVVMGLFDNCGHAFKGLEGDRQHYFDLPDVIRNVSAVTGACLATRAEVFQEVAGFDEDKLPVAFNDIDLCLKIRQKGYRVLYTPHAILYHHEAFSKTGKDLVPHPIEVQAMQSRWKTVIEGDPFYNPNLTHSAEDYSLRCQE